MTSSVLPTILALTMAAATTTVAASVYGSPPPRRSMPYLRKDDLQNLIPNDGVVNPSVLENWMSVNEDTEFLPLLNQDPKAQQKRMMDKMMKEKNSKIKNSKTSHQQQKAGRKLEDAAYNDDAAAEDETTSGKWDGYDPYSVQPFVQGLGDYDEYQQAWRLLGFIVDCNTENDDDYAVSQHSNDYNTVSENACARYVLWGAYVDLDYEGAGIAEYQYYDASTGKWDKNACQYADEGDSRCAKMDCHLENTNFSLLGFFKHRSIDDWMEQLFKHEGMCVWSDEQYSFMKNARNAWPKACTDTGQYITHNGEDTSLYYDMKPLQKGKMGVALYTDDTCLEEYSASTSHIESIIGNIFANAGSHHSGDYNDDDAYENLSLKESLAKWDDAFNVWHTCHPCVAHDLENYAGDKYSCYDDDDAGGDDAYNRKKKRRRKLGGEQCPDGEKFECYDDAGYTNVNQVSILYVHA